MKLSSYHFENKEDREMAFHNIVKWYGATIVQKIDKLDLNISGPKDIIIETHKIIEKHFGKLKSDFFRPSL
ncbi:MAG: hypothetical protein EOP04_29010 [Proteobacteria bacterium]|nr:MAG: hypothetical protein EOP04_29010 [Pseudomonadota bacterium]